jgi:NAD(P)-dependent dehydrogenase (short-subunit alcohol dehydrogenase family)
MKQINQKKIAIITGGCGLFGTLQIKALEELKYKIVVLDKNKKKIKSLKNKKEFKNTDFHYCDISKIKNILNVKKKIITKYKTVDILVNNAANDTVPAKKKKNLKSPNFIVEINKLSNDIDVGLIGAIYCSKIFGELMAKNKQGIILNISSDLSVIAPDQRLYSHLGISKPISYSVIKHSLTGLTKYLASYWAKYNVRVNSFSPGGIYNNQEKIFVKKIKKLIPMGRMAKKEEYKETIKFLCSDASSYITGQNIVSDGGRSII